MGNSATLVNLRWRCQFMDRSVAFWACNNSSVLSTLVGAQWGSQGSSIVFSVNSPNCTLANSFCYFCCQNMARVPFHPGEASTKLCGTRWTRCRKAEKTWKNCTKRPLSLKGWKGEAEQKETMIMITNYRLMCAKMKKAKGGRETGRDLIGTVAWLRQRFVFLFIHSLRIAWRSWQFASWHATQCE